MSPFRPSILILAIAFGILSGCEKMALLSPTGSTITLTINKTVVPINGTAEVIAAVIESAGTPVQNGTVVTFTASFGVIEPREARTEGGVARVTFTGTQSGTAKIGAFSGGARVAAASELEVKVGAAAAERVTVRTEPTSIPQTGGTVQVIAVVSDIGGNPLSTAPVSFTTDNGSLSSSSGVTDANGEVRVSLTTTRATKVTATAGPKTSGEFAVSVLTAPTVTIGSCTTTPSVGVAVNCTVTPTTIATGSPIQNVTVNWGDGTGEQPLGAVTGPTVATHTYSSPGNYTVTAAAVDLVSQRGTASVALAVIRVLPIVTLTVPASGATGVPVIMSVAPPPSPTQPIANVTVDFGDGSTRNLGAITGITSFTKTYSASGAYTVSATVTDASGQRATPSAAIVIARGAPPTVTLTVPVGTIPRNALTAITVTATPAAAGGPAIQSVRVTMTDGTVLFTGTGSATFLYTFLGSGPTVLTAVAVDSTGNEGRTQTAVNISS